MEGKKGIDGATVEKQFLGTKQTVPNGFNAISVATSAMKTEEVKPIVTSCVLCKTGTGNVFGKAIFRNANVLFISLTTAKVLDQNIHYLGLL